MAINGTNLDNLANKVNAMIGYKNYQKVQKIMNQFDEQLQKELTKDPQMPNKVDHKIDNFSK